MKVKLNLTIDDGLLARIKQYAASKEISVSELVERHFQNLTRPSNKKNILDLVDKLKKPAIPSSKNLKKAFYEDQAKKYGF